MKLRCSIESLADPELKAISNPERCKTNEYNVFNKI